MKTFAVGDYLVWDYAVIGAERWHKQYGQGLFVVTKIGCDYYDIRIRHVNGKRIMGPWAPAWFKKSTFLGLAAKAIQDAQKKS